MGLPKPSRVDTGTHASRTLYNEPDSNDRSRLDLPRHSSSVSLDSTRCNSLSTPDPVTSAMMTESTKETQQEVVVKQKVDTEGANVRRDSQEEISPTETLVNPRDEKDLQPDGGDHAKETRDLGSWERVIKLDLGKGTEEVVVIDWAPNDPENPFNFPLYRKSILLATACLIAFSTALNCTSVAITATWGTEWFGVDRIAFIASQTIMLSSIAVTPMILAPASEVFGRNGIYQITTIINACLFIPQATTHSYPGLLVCRFLQGTFSSVGNSMVGGTVADLFRPHQRGSAMTTFALVNFVGGAMGSVLTGWVGMAGGLPWCYGGNSRAYNQYQAILSAVSIVCNALFLRETRGDVLLSRRAKRLSKSTGRKHLCPADLQRKSFMELMKVSLVRPFLYLATEPIVSALSAWIGFAWSCMFLGASSTILVFSQYDWNPGQLGSIQATLAIGAVLGFLSNYHQEYLYSRKARKSPTGRAPPEARLYHAAYVGLLYPLGFMAYAWTGRAEIPWIVPAIFLTISYWGLFAMYAGVFNYIADAYEIYSSSAQAAQSFVRNVGAAIIPQFGRQIYQAMGYPHASTMVASISLVLGIAPILLLRYGKTLRARSRVASALEKESEAIDAEA